MKCVDKYCLGHLITDINGLKEFTRKEYFFAFSLGMFKIFRKEKFFHGGADIEFASMFWDDSTIAINNKKEIYKIALQMFPVNEEDAMEVLNQVVKVIISEEGKYTIHPEFSNKYIWEIDKNTSIFLNLRRIRNYFGVNLIFTTMEKE